MTSSMPAALWRIDPVMVLERAIDAHVLTVASSIGDLAGRDYPLTDANYLTIAMRHPCSAQQVRATHAWLAMTVAAQDGPGASER